MSAVYGDNYTKALAGVMHNLCGAEYGGKVRAILETYEASALDSGSSIAVGKPPKGWKYLGGWVIGDDLSSAGTLALGISGATTKFMAATVFTTAGQQTAAFAIDSIGYEFDGSTPIIVTTGVEAITGTVKVILLFVAPN